MARIRSWCALALVIVASLWQTAGLLREAIQAPPPAQPSVAVHDERFAPARVALRDVDAVGYLTPLEPAQLQADIVQAAYFFRTQYSLAPTLLRRTAAAPLVVADFEALAYAGAVVALPDGQFTVSRPDLFEDLSLAQDFGRGVMLFRHRDR